MDSSCGGAGDRKAQRVNIKLTISLIGLAVIAIIVYLVNPFSREEEKKIPEPWFYQVHVDDMTSIQIDHQGETAAFVKTKSDSWAFDMPELIPPDHNRWGGIDFILGGPQTRRDLSETKIIIEDASEYGLDNPHTIVTIGLTLERSVQFSLGDKTTDGEHHYGKVTGFPQLFLIADSWGDVISRLATEPPYPKWFVKRDPSTIDEVNIFPKSEDASTDTSQLRFSRVDNENWELINYSVNDRPFPVDKEKWASIEPLLKGPDGVSVELHKVADRDYSPWELGDNSASIEIRFKTKSEKGTTFINGALIIIGKKTPDGNHYYAMPGNDALIQPVLKISSSWVDPLLSLYEDPPYAN